MGIYILLILGIFISKLLFNPSTWGEVKSKKYFLRATFILTYLVCALRSYTVGRDVPGYRTAYLAVANHSWGDFEYIYFEKGYQLLTKICSFLGLSWQVYLAIVYLIILVPIFIFIKKYSKNTILSVLTFICYMYFEFDLTGIRQALAQSICLIAFMVLLESKRWKYVKYILIVTVAVLFHKCAFAGYFLLPILWIKDIRKATALVAVVTVGCIPFRSLALTFIKTFFMKDSMNANANLYFGSNMIFLLVLAILFVTVEIIRERNAVVTDNEEYYLNQRINEDGNELNYDYQNLFVRSFLLSIFFAIFFGTDNAARSYMVLNQVIIISLPNALEWLEARSRQIIIFAYVLFLLAFFYFNTLHANNFDIIPYQFFWNV